MLNQCSQKCPGTPQPASRSLGNPSLPTTPCQSSHSQEGLPPRWGQPSPALMACNAAHAPASPPGEEGELDWPSNNSCPRSQTKERNVHLSSQAQHNPALLCIFPHLATPHTKPHTLLCRPATILRHRRPCKPSAQPSPSPMPPAVGGLCSAQHQDLCQ